MVVDVVNYTSNIPYTVEVDVAILVTENLLPDNNEITLNLLTVNGEADAISSNNSSSISTDLSDSSHDYVTLIINTDDYPEETSWQVYDELNNELVAFGELNGGDDVVTEEICVDYSSCLSLLVFDSYGDGICCGFGEGDFLLLNSAGETLITNNGEFDSEAIEPFCPNGEGCAFTAVVSTINVSEENATDGVLTINPTSGFSPYQYSIDGGVTFVDNNTFEDLATGDYMILIMDASGTCSYEETVTLEVEIIDNVNDISLSDIKVFPNPTKDVLVIEISETSTVAGDVNIEIYDNLGRLIESDVISRFGDASKAVISLKQYAPGSYFAKCYNEYFGEYFKVIKL
jgi:hypothetical protein